MQIAIIGIDLGKNICSLAGIDGSGQVVVRRRVRRENVFKIVSQLKPETVAMEACGGAHHLGRLLRDAGFEVRLMSPEYVHPYVKAQKNDDRDAEAIAEAATRPTTIRRVEVRGATRQTLHRGRDQLVGERTSLMKQIRSLLLERAHVIPQGRARLAARLAELLDDPTSGLSPRINRLIVDTRERWIALDQRIAELNGDFAEQANGDVLAQRLLTIPG